MDDRAIAFARVGSKGEDPFDLEGDLLDGHIRVEKLVGEGELSVVYRGLHEGINAPVAIKCLNLPDTLDPKLVAPISENFREGARVHYRLAQGHLDIVQTLAFGMTVAPRTGQEIPYVVREWLDGSSLAEDFAARARAKTRPRTSAQAVELLGSAADAIAYAHAEGVCHHSLSPRDLFLTTSQRREVLKVLGFGTARDAATPPVDAGLRLHSTHAAPEQLDRQLGTPSPATDVFAFALVLFETVTGRPYFMPGAHVSELLRVAESREPFTRRLSGLVVPRDLEPVLSRALAPKPRERQPSLRAFWDDVKRAVEQGSPLWKAPPRPQFAPPRPPPIVEPAVPVVPIVAAPKALPTPPEAPPPLPISCTAEVALPVTTSVSMSSLPAMTVSESIEPPLDRDTVPTPPMFEDEAAPTSTATPGRRFGVLWKMLTARTRTVLAEAPVVVSRIGVSRIGALTTCMLVLFVVGVALIGRSTTRGSGHALEPPDRAPARTVVDETSALVFVETSLRVLPKATGFDRIGAKELLDETAADLESCTRHGGPRGPGSVRVIFDPSGKIVRLQIGPPYAGTSTGSCISSRFVATRIPAFKGPPRAMNYVFSTIPFPDESPRRAALR